MDILIIEDEVKAARALEKLVAKLRPDARVLASIQSVEAAVDYLQGHDSPDLIFMDVQLSDGISFDIFKAVPVRCPVIFCTAYGEYAMDAIKENGVDYLLKPFSEADLQHAFDKVDNFTSFFQRNSESSLMALVQKISSEESKKKSFLVFKGNRYLTVKTDDIAYFYIQATSPSMVTFKGETFDLSQSLDQLQQVLSEKQFFRLNRQYLVNFSAIKEVEHYFGRKLFVKLTVDTPDKLLVGKEKANVFLQWMADR